jgi:hypothetical protein
MGKHKQANIEHIMRYHRKDSIGQYRIYHGSSQGV